MTTAKLRCAKWCGHGCTETEYQAAKTKAKSLAKRLGRGWKPRVWENLGWHWKAVAGQWEVYPSVIGSKQTGYFAILQGVGVEHGKTPKAAVRNVLPILKSSLDRLERIAATARRLGFQL